MRVLKRCYHHGDLRNALIVAAAELIEERHSLSFSITEAARRAGVSCAAPYRHFKDKEALLYAVRDLAFIGLDARMEEAAGSSPRGTVDNIIALGAAYIGYAREKQAFFALMWEARGDIEARREEAKMKSCGFYILTDALEGCIEAGILPKHIHPYSMATQLWAMVHGVATLETNQMLDVFDNSADPQRLIELGTVAMFAGLQRS